MTHSHFSGRRWPRLSIFLATCPAPRRTWDGHIRPQRPTPLPLSHGGRNATKSKPVREGLLRFRGGERGSPVITPTTQPGHLGSTDLPEAAVSTSSGRNGKSGLGYPESPEALQPGRGPTAPSKDLNPFPPPDLASLGHELRPWAVTVT